MEGAGLAAILAVLLAALPFIALALLFVLVLLTPSRSHHTESRLSPKRLCGLAKGTPLSVRMAFGSPNSWKTRSNTTKAYFSLVVESASQARRYRLEKSLIVSG